jgi:hypothetical protein
MTGRSTSAIAPAPVLPAEAEPGAGLAAGTPVGGHRAAEVFALEPSGAVVGSICRGDRTRGLVIGAP